MTMPCSSISPLRAVHFVVAGALVLLFTSQDAVAADDAALRAEMLKAMKSRTEQFQSVDIEWTMIGRIRNSSRFHELPLGADKPPAKGEEFFAVEQQMRLRLDGTRFGVDLSTTDGDRLGMPIGSRSTFNGEVSQLYSGESPPGSVGAGTIARESDAIAPRVLYSRPVFLMFRPLSATLAQVDFATAQLMPNRVPVGQRMCHVFVNKHIDHPLADRFYLDPDQGFILLRYEEVVEDTVRHQIEITYESDPKHGPIPARWECTTIDALGRFDSSRTCTVTHYSINAPVPKEAFTIDFPPGTYVEDKIAGKAFHLPGGPTGVEPAAVKQAESASRWVRVVWIINALAVAIAATLWVIGKKQH